MDKTKRLAIEQLERISKNLGAIGETVDYTELAIEALAQEPCEDCISRESVDRIFQCTRGLGEDTVVAIYEHILDLPSVQPKSSCSEKLNDCEDCISRDEALKTQFTAYDHVGVEYKVVLSEMLKILPSVQPKAESDVLDEIRAKIEDWQTDIHDNEYDAKEHDFVFERIFEIIDEYRKEQADADTTRIV